MSITEPTLSHVAPVDVQGGGPAIFTRIYQPDCNLAVWQRSLPADVEGYVQQLLQAGSRISVRELLPPDTVAGALIKQLPDFSGRQALADDVQQLAEMFACLFELKRVGVRLASLQTAMCPRFHVDRLPCRLVSTYSGPGTHWLNAQQREQLLEQKGQEPEHWQQLTIGDVGLMKGDGWEGEEGRGLWHRSPPVPTGYRRLFLSMDFAD
ncbi:DUF1826 domain-containing protein [Oceanimonas doudoroffii]|uniref:Succinylglutamate desuccinylase n=1 Tax=Oceanimonas doudoroffii TaxID=84158 RepID=A0A233RD43_9GAMM|nr:DUF1826 domain-containing protein [Oceanimonas doudoroffii]OXY81318.1 hypothetical protein B6S08_12555 [Oceanimonas doudoroffii]